MRSVLPFLGVQTSSMVISSPTEESGLPSNSRVTTAEGSSSLKSSGSAIVEAAALPLFRLDAMVDYKGTLQSSIILKTGQTDRAFPVFISSYLW